MSMVYFIGALLPFNQPKFCPNASWEANGTLFAYAQTEPFGLFIDTNDTVYVAMQETNRVQVWSSQSGAPIRTLSTDLNNPATIFVTTNGNIYVDSGANYRVELWTLNATKGTNVMNVTNQCMGLFIDTNNTLYCSASESHVVLAKSLTESSQPIVTVAGKDKTCGDGADELCLPNGIFVDTNFNLYVADWVYNRIQKFKLGEKNGQTVAGYGSSQVTDLSGPTSVTLDADGYLFIVDMNNNRVMGSGLNGFRCVVGCSKTITSLLNRFNGPRTAAFDSSGNLFVTDRSSSRILKFALKNNSCSKLTYTSTKDSRIRKSRFPISRILSESNFTHLISVVTV